MEPGNGLQPSAEILVGIETIDPLTQKKKMLNRHKYQTSMIQEKMSSA